MSFINPNLNIKLNSDLISMNEINYLTILVHPSPIIFAGKNQETENWNHHINDDNYL